jgi:hypothetical protein
MIRKCGGSSDSHWWLLLTQAFFLCNFTKSIYRSATFFLEPSKQSPATIKEVLHDWTSEGQNQASPTHRAFLAWLSDVYLCESLLPSRADSSRLFLVNIHRSLCTTLLLVCLEAWYVCLTTVKANMVALAGSELALVANLSAYTLSTPWVLHFVTSKRGLFWNRVAMVIGGMASWILPNPFSRLLAVSIGTWCGWLALFGNWARLKGSKEMIAEGQGESILQFLAWC